MQQREEVRFLEDAGVRERERVQFCGSAEVDGRVGCAVVQEEVREEGGA